MIVSKATHGILYTSFYNKILESSDYSNCNFRLLPYQDLMWAVPCVFCFLLDGTDDVVGRYKWRHTFSLRSSRIRLHELGFLWYDRAFQECLALFHFIGKECFALIDLWLGGVALVLGREFCDKRPVTRELVAHSRKKRLSSRTVAAISAWWLTPG